MGLFGKAEQHYVRGQPFKISNLRLSESFESPDWLWEDSTRRQPEQLVPSSIA